MAKEGEPTGLLQRLPGLAELKARVRAQLASLRPDHVRHMNPSPYKVRKPLLCCLVVLLSCVVSHACSLHPPHTPRPLNA